MNSTSLILSVGIPLAFAAGVACHRYVISEADKIKAHVTAAETRIRQDVKVLLDKAAAKV